MSGKIKCLIICIIGILIMLEFCVSPSLSTQIKNGNIVYLDLIKEQDYNNFDDLKPQKNIFVGDWRSGGTVFVFRDDGTGTVTVAVLIDYTEHVPFTYEYNEKQITVTGIDIMSGELVHDVYNYELDGNILKFEYEKSGKILYLIKQ